MTVSLEPICVDRNIKIDPKKVNAAAQQDLPVLEDLGRLFEMLAVMEDMKKEVSEFTFSDEAMTIYGDIAAGANGSDPFERSLANIEAVIKAIDARDAAGQARLASDREVFAKMLMIVNLAQQKFSKVRAKLSGRCAAEFDQLLSAEAEPSATLKLIKAVQNAILATSLRLSPAVKEKLGIGKPNWVETLSRDDVEKVLVESCRAMEYIEPKKPAARPIAPSQPTAPDSIAESKFAYLARLGAGYRYGVGDAPLLAGAEQGGYTQANVGLDYKLFPELTGRFNYSGFLVIDQNLEGTREAADFGALSLQYDANGFQVTGGAEGLRHGIDEDQAIAAGAVEGALKLDAIQPFVGGIAGYDLSASELVYGGRLGAELTFGGQLIDLRVDYFMEALGGQAGYTLNAGPLSLGAFAVYRFVDEEHRFGAGLEGSYTLTQLLGSDLRLGLSANNDYAILTLISGGAKPARPSLLQGAVDPFMRSR